MKRLPVVVFAFLISLVAVQSFAQCGVERWSIKVGNDSGASSINLSSYVSSTIYNFYQSTRPSTIPSNSRVAPRETTQYRLGGTLTKYKREDDSDYHLVIQDGSGRQMIIEIPSPNCVGSGSPFGSGIANARRQFDAKFTATTSFKTTSTAVTVTGIGFWDFLHGQTGVAPNGIEVHPVLNITFGSSAASTPGSVEASAYADEAPLPADMVRDNDGGVVHLYRGGTAVSDAALYHGGVVIEEPSIQLVFVGDQWTTERMRPVQQMARVLNLSRDFDSLDRYGILNRGMRVSSVQLAGGPIANDLDVQRTLAAAIEAGRIQHLDEETLFIVMLQPGLQPAVGASTDYLSYHSEFHPDDLAMRYVVVRGGLDPVATRDALFGSVARALVNPNANGWF
jgi:hypothetical protein